ncbi:hypothetical protein CAJCM15448_47290 [Candidozyma auris]|nr:hypothetical protein CAJCM15448_47290 [[Candida] auris]
MPNAANKLPRRKGITRYTRAAFVLTTAALIILFDLGLPVVFANDINMKVRLYTNNIRYDNKNLVPGEHAWKEREPLVSESIRFHTQAGPSVVCLQEVLHNQLEDILKDLNSGNDGQWDYYGVGRTDGKQAGEYAPILFKTADWKAVDKKTYWLSPTPDTPSKGWDAALERIVTTVVLESKHEGGQKVKVLNTHFDHKGVEARRQSAKLIMSKMEQGPEPAFLCGDFNTEPTDEPYKLLTEGGFKDSRIQGVGYGYKSTFTDFNHDKEANTIIDYIWADHKSHWQTYGVVPNYFDFYMSDHRPVIADYTIGGLASRSGSQDAFSIHVDEGGQINPLSHPHKAEPLKSSIDDERSLDIASLDIAVGVHTEQAGSDEAQQQALADNGEQVASGDETCKSIFAKLPPQVCKEFDKRTVLLEYKIRPIRTDEAERDTFVDELMSFIDMLEEYGNKASMEFITVLKKFAQSLADERLMDIYFEWGTSAEIMLYFSNIILHLEIEDVESVLAVARKAYKQRCRQQAFWLLVRRNV